MGVSPLLSPRARRFAGLAVAVAVVVLLLLSHDFGRADPTNNYRPLLPPDALATGCFPLPDGARLDLPHQIRRDGDVTTPEGPRRDLFGQYDLVDRDEALARIVAAFTAVGYTESEREDDGDAVRVVLTKGPTTVRALVAELPHTSAETLVRGEFTLDLPVVAVAKDDPICSDPKATKRWPRKEASR
ncbi:hypothetical protein [Pimelobacter sp. 30-1]|uniref:hypothetical protein n=1 Tax=Pimelobacter sp. 30-1 TaxID=2004991 RepID=UPI001C0591F0|nr:hypothetical protein [Pimelobacter sp. 30-1]